MPQPPARSAGSVGEDQDHRDRDRADGAASGERRRAGKREVTEKLLEGHVHGAIAAADCERPVGMRWQGEDQ